MTSDPQTPKLISPDLSLKEKIGTNVNLQRVFSEEKIQAAQKVINEVRDEFLQDITDKITELIEKTRLDSSSTKTKELLTHNSLLYKGKAESLGFDLLALTLDSLNRYSQTFLPGDEAANKLIVGKHLDIMGIIIRDQIAGDGDDTGRALLKALPELVKHFHPSGA